MDGVAIVVFCDLVDSTGLLARLGDDRMEVVRRTHVADVSDAVVSAGGRVLKLLGDGAMASFDSALCALRAAAAIQSAVVRLDGEHGGLGIAARVGIAAGELIVGGEDLYGMPVVIASRLCSAAGRGEVLVQELVCELVAWRGVVALDDAQEFVLKGVPTAVRASRLRWRELANANDGGLSPRETEILRLIAQGLSNCEIAEKLGVGRVTVADHVFNLRAKLGQHSRVSIVNYARREGLI